MKSYLTILWYDAVAAILSVNDSSGFMSKLCCNWLNGLRQGHILSTWYSLYWVLFFINEWRELITTKYQLLCIYLWQHNNIDQGIRPVNRIYASIVIKFLSATTQLENTLQRRYMSIMASQITGHSSVCSTICSGQHQRNIRASRYCPFVRGIHRWWMNSPHKGSVTRKKFPFDDVFI